MNIYFEKDSQAKDDHFILRGKAQQGKQTGQCHIGGMLQNWNEQSTSFEFRVQHPALRKTWFLVKPNQKYKLFLFLSITKL